MDDEELWAIINGPLGHEQPGIRQSRMIKALKAVLDGTGFDGELALREHLQQAHNWPERRKAADR